MGKNHKPQPVIITIFGGSGDLTKRKLVPAVFNLYHDERMPEQFSIIGLGRTEYSHETYRSKLKGDLDEFSRRGATSEEEWEDFKSHLFYEVMDVYEPTAYEELANKIYAMEKEWGVEANLIFYLAIAPELMETVATSLGKSGICQNIHRTRLVVEKPFGHDLESAKELNQLLMGIFDESQIFRIDHYLGKESVQNMLVFRFANVIFEPIWNRKYIEHVQITVSETVGVEDRGGYYDHTGALKDMIQNHVLQLLCFVAMEPPVSFDSDEIRNRKVDVLRAIRKYSGKEIFENTARGQYGPGWMKGKEASGYREEPKVNPKSNTETFAAVKFHIDNWRWQGVPFYVRSGKRMPQKTSVITVQFLPVPHQIFPEQVAEGLKPNRVTISINPDTGIKVRFQAKKVGLDMRLNPADLEFSYSDAYDVQQPEAYETLLYDVMTNDATSFMRSDEVEAAWEVVMPIIEAWENNQATEFPNYAVNSWGPESAERLVAKSGFHWINLPIKSSKKK